MKNNFNLRKYLNENQIREFIEDEAELDEGSEEQLQFEGKEVAIDDIIYHLKSMDNYEWTDLLEAMEKHFIENADELLNMDANSIAGHLRGAIKGIEDRTGN